ncbi:hypothetical protein IAQ61_008283 [Plenodomus lingam]|uniref:Uncharacterized protein n=1 Tax=Leptosphaeria maculans (strain JN3 / isolate v23.1.3 / race Av1-4-5-6-7-8) TaxID=985895 RepID=E4ZZH2_LEPMJ|nr:hypothetical protein LEMA_P098980.1 [Plenodomus lingam JN3]KAH9867689.1 hypothetical protein IAQ61_008283 [Plenodomus lingam]CBX96767.1 hypothetical protein LEMA_P098980.1 [Plenodomus lingam JN3]
MPPKLRTSTVEFRSLLLPPVRVSLCTFQSVFRPPSAPSATRRVTPTPSLLSPCRALHLYKTARSKTLLGQHKLLTFSPYEVAGLSRSTHKVNLVKSDQNQTVVAADLSLQELYDEHVQPGKMLYLAHNIGKAVGDNLERLRTEDKAQEYRNYAVMEPYSCIKQGSKEITLRPTRGKQLGELKCVMVRLSSPSAYFKICMDRAYQFIEAGSPVEFRIRLRGSTNKMEKQKAGPIENWRWMHDHWPHLRPDFILKSMPKGAMFLIDPVTDGYIVQFVISLAANVMPTVDLNERLWKVKKGVQKSTSLGRQSQLPKFMRQQLADEGLTDYSPDSGLPKAQAMAGYTRDRKGVAAWFSEGEESSLAKEALEGYKNLDPADIREIRRAHEQWEKNRKESDGMLPPLEPTKRYYTKAPKGRGEESATQTEDDDQGFGKGKRKHKRPHWESRGRSK